MVKLVKVLFFNKEVLYKVVVLEEYCFIDKWGGYYNVEIGYYEGILWVVICCLVICVIVVVMFILGYFLFCKVSVCVLFFLCFLMKWSVFVDIFIFYLIIL